MTLFLLIQFWMNRLNMVNSVSFQTMVIAALIVHHAIGLGQPLIPLDVTLNTLVVDACLPMLFHYQAMMKKVGQSYQTAVICAETPVQTAVGVGRQTILRLVVQLMLNAPVLIISMVITFIQNFQKSNDLHTESDKRSVKFLLSLLICDFNNFLYI